MTRSPTLTHTVPCRSTSCRRRRVLWRLCLEQAVQHQHLQQELQLVQHELLVELAVQPFAVLPLAVQRPAVLPLAVQPSAVLPWTPASRSRHRASRSRHRAHLGAETKTPLWRALWRGSPKLSVATLGRCSHVTPVLQPCLCACCWPRRGTRSRQS